MITCSLKQSAYNESLSPREVNKASFEDILREESCFHVTLGAARKKSGRFHKEVSTPGLSFKSPEELSEPCVKGREGATMELLSAIFSAFFLFSATFVSFVTAGIPHDGIHWTYTGGLFKNLICLF